ncbi:nucleoside deaminase [Halopseudomonas salegens]|uniref:Guanine deaminase n=1 Tax=Halopseudomonas salegens TaxID=1434072 RepID=A0A1H2EQS0_9GAMM|nr:nucleoside deaminase [Halopseudomonas salegens]SDT97379.1 guanine deaminase [Halopseudomonas salegens]
MTGTTDSDYLRRCVELALQSVEAGGGPFAALLVQDGRIIAESCNEVVQTLDPTAHAEVQAIRKASQALQQPHFPDATLYSSCEPCPMCLAAIHWAHIPRIRFAASHHEAARGGFADTPIALKLYGQARPVNISDDTLQQIEIAGAGKPFDAWLALEDRFEY